MFYAIYHNYLHMKITSIHPRILLRFLMPKRLFLCNALYIIICPFSFGHFTVSLRRYDFWLHLSFFEGTTSDYTLASSKVRLLITPLVSSTSSNLSILSVPDEGYSRTEPCATNMISTLLLWWFMWGSLSHRQLCLSCVAFRKY